MWFASSSMSPYIEWMYFCWIQKKERDRKGKFVFFSCHTIYSSITFMDVHTKKKSFSSHFHLPSHPFPLLSLQSFSLNVYMCTFPIFYCHRFMLCSVSLFTNTIWQFFLENWTSFVLYVWYNSHNSNGNKKSLSLIDIRSRWSMSNDAWLCLGNRAHKIRKNWNE